ncbi:hypothetical protein [Mesonia sp. HuA40]|uniref:hypothetical protein n=1 Tax=Mesonia sp. HuA40 TaxID=2602761 RepID=UPI0011C745BA|nr:hypothetical protein [Mesonia sp. HuA40]TXK73965.1 hypothetical protein FT993_03645 [Mesonia sp. HuA40]
MILLQAPTFQIDLSAYGVKLNEESDLFSDNIYKSYSLPFTIKADEELLVKLGLPTLGNIQNINQEIKCRIVLPNRHLPATLFLGEMRNHNLECNITYGKNNLAVYDVALKDLPWPFIIPNEPLIDFAKNQTQNSWPNSQMAFPVVYAPDIVKGDEYDKFLGFVNNYDTQNDKYIENEIVQEQDDQGANIDVYYNKNVMLPMPYLLEIVKMGYAQENKKVVGAALLDEDLKRAVYFPKGYLEKFAANEYAQISFTTRSGVDRLTPNSPLYNVYDYRFTPTKQGTYKLDLFINLPPGLASAFFLTVFREDALSQALTAVKSYQSFNTRVQIQETLTFNVEIQDTLDPVLVRLAIPYTDVNIEEYNSLEWKYDEGRLNVFPQIFNLANFMPDLKFGEFMNELKNWLNLDVDVQENYVKIDFVKDSILQRPKVNHEHLELVSPLWRNNNNRVYVLKYSNGDEIYYDKTGQVYQKPRDGQEAINIDMDVQPLEVESNKSIITAKAPEERAKIDFILHDAPSVFVNPKIAENLSLQEVATKNWFPWLRFRVNSKTCKEEFECSIHEEVELKPLSYKYKELLIIKKLNKKFLSEKRMRVEIEAESF